jgi:tripartite-type tricarboxylate transporter receptor subunit TctC
MTCGRRTLLASLVGTLATVVVSATVHAAFPERPITLIVPFAPGGPADTFARIIGERMSLNLGQPIVVENVGGAGGTTGTARAAGAKPDGYAVMIGHMGTHGVAPAIYTNLRYDPARDFAPIGMIATTAIVVITKKGFPADSLQEFAAYVRAHQDKVTEAHGGVGSIAHTTCALLQSIMETRTARVAYRGTGESMKDLIAGQVDFGCDQIVNVVPQVQAGTIKALAIASAERSPALKDVPTATEGGMPQFRVSAWQALFAPKNTPPEVVATLNDALVKALDDQHTRQRLMDLGGVIPDKPDRSPEALQALVEGEVALWTRVIRGTSH